MRAVDGRSAGLVTLWRNVNVELAISSETVVSKGAGSMAESSVDRSSTDPAFIAQIISVPAVDFGRIFWKRWWL